MLSNCRFWSSSETKMSIGQTNSLALIQIVYISVEYTGFCIDFLYIYSYLCVILIKDAGVSFVKYTVAYIFIGEEGTYAEK